MLASTTKCVLLATVLAILMSVAHAHATPEDKILRGKQIPDTVAFSTLLKNISRLSSRDMEFATGWVAWEMDESEVSAQALVEYLLSIHVKLDADIQNLREQSLCRRKLDGLSRKSAVAAWDDYYEQEDALVLSYLSIMKANLGEARYAEVLAWVEHEKKGSVHVRNGFSDDPTESHHPIELIREICE